MADCTACSRPAPDATICAGCTDLLAGNLRQIPWLVGQLTITLARQARMGGRDGARSAETPVPFDTRASVDLETLHVDLPRWARAVAQHRGVLIDAPDEPIALSRWLLRWVGAAAQHPDAGELLDDVRAMTHAAERTIDRAPDLRFVGPCDNCGQDLYVLPHAKAAQCKTEGCGATYPMEERRAWLIEQTYGQLLTANEMSRAIAELVPGQRITPDRIRQWAARGKLTKYLPHARDPHKRSRYLVEDVINQLRGTVENTANKAG